MKNKELIAKLTKFDPEWEVTITDGYKAVGYEGNFEIKEFEGTVDIGIGGMDYVQKKENLRRCRRCKQIF